MAVDSCLRQFYFPTFNRFQLSSNLTNDIFYKKFYNQSQHLSNNGIYLGPKQKAEHFLQESWFIFDSDRSNSLLRSQFKQIWLQRIFPFCMMTVHHSFTPFSIVNLYNFAFFLANFVFHLSTWFAMAWFLFAVYCIIPRFYVFFWLGVAIFLLSIGSMGSRGFLANATVFRMPIGFIYSHYKPLLCQFFRKTHITSNGNNIKRNYFHYFSIIVFDKIPQLLENISSKPLLQLFND